MQSHNATNGVAADACGHLRISVGAYDRAVASLATYDEAGAFPNSNLFNSKLWTTVLERARIDLKPTAP